MSQPSTSDITSGDTKTIIIPNSKESLNCLQHVGYTIHIDEIQDLIIPFITIDKLASIAKDYICKKRVYTAIHYNAGHISLSDNVLQSKQNMLQWFRKRRGKVTVGVIRKLWMDGTKKAVVAEVYIDGSPSYVVVVNGNVGNVSPMSIKAWTGSGQMETKIELKEAIKVRCTAYAEMYHPGSNTNQVIE